jgi:hypothetical protein
LIVDTRRPRPVSSTTSRRTIDQTRDTGLPQIWEWRHWRGIFSIGSLVGDGRVVWFMRLAKPGAGGETRCADVMEISRSDSVGDIADPGLPLAEAMQPGADATMARWHQSDDDGKSLGEPPSQAICLPSDYQRKRRN